MRATQVLLEREQDLDLLADVLAEVGSSGGRVVLVRGEAGIGKSRLAREFIATHSDDSHVLVGWCDDLSTPQPLGPFWDVARSEPSLTEPLENADRRALLEAVMDLLSRTLRPTVLVLEDTQWADDATLDAIKYLGRRIGGTNGLLVLTYRDDQVDHDHPLRRVIGDLAPQDLVRISLHSLSAEAVASMVDNTGLDSDEVLALTDGNPLFVSEIISSGVEGVPSSVQDSVLARAGKLSTAARQVLDLTSVIPGESERSLIEHIVEPTEDQMIECVQQGLLRVEDDSVSFHHELTRRAVESALNPADRRRLNQQVLAELGKGADSSRVVHHAREANNVEAIIEFAPKAARAAMAMSSHREASAHFRTLEPYLDRITEADRALIADDWGRNEYYLGRIESLDIVTRAIELHRSSGDDHALARALIFAVRVNQNYDRPEAADACIAEAVAILESYPPSGDLASAVSRSAWLSIMRGDWVRAIELADQALELAEETGDELTVIRALNTKGVATYSRGDSDGFRLLEESRRRAEQSGYPFEETQALINMSSVVAERRKLEQADDLARRTIDTAARYEIPAFENYARAQLAQVLVWKGEWAAAEDVAAEVLGSNPRMDSLHRRHLGWVIGTLQTRRGWPEAHTTLDRTWSAVEAAGELQTILPVAATVAEYIWLTGATDADRIARLREVLNEGIRLGHPWVVGELAFWLWKLGELAEIPEGIAEPYRLVMQGDPIAAAEIWEKLGYPYERAIALSHGDTTSQLEALDILDTLGATAVADKLRQALRDQGVPVPRRRRVTRGPGVGLTARQSEVLSLLAEGLSNVDIADRLFLSPRTVEHHVAAVMSKLNASSRDEAVEKATEQELLTAV